MMMMIKKVDRCDGFFWSENHQNTEPPKRGGGGGGNGGGGTTNERRSRSVVRRSTASIMANEDYGCIGIAFYFLFGMAL